MSCGPIRLPYSALVYNNNIIIILVVVIIITIITEQKSVVLIPTDYQPIKLWDFQKCEMNLIGQRGLAMRDLVASTIVTIVTIQQHLN